MCDVLKPLKIKKYVECNDCHARAKLNMKITLEDLEEKGWYFIDELTLCPNCHKQSESE